MKKQMKHALSNLLFLLYFFQAAAIDRDIDSCLQKTIHKRIAEQDKVYGQLFKKAFEAVQSKHRVKHVLQQGVLSKAFQIRHEVGLQSGLAVSRKHLDDEMAAISTDIDAAQQLLLCELYVQFFIERIKELEVLLQLTSQSESYFKKELFKQTLPLLRRGVHYWLTTNAQCKETRKKIKALQHIQDQAATLLGLFLQGNLHLSKIQILHDTTPCFTASVTPLYQHFSMSLQGTSLQQQFLDLVWFSDRMQILLQEFSLEFEKHRMPGHFKRNRATYIELGLAAAVCFYFYKQYQDEMMSYKRMKELAQYAIDDCVKDPIGKLIKELINPTTTELKLVENAVDIKSFPESPVIALLPESPVIALLPESPCIQKPDMPLDAPITIKLDPFAPTHSPSDLLCTAVGVRSIVDPINKNQKKIENFINQFLKDVVYEDRQKIYNLLAQIVEAGNKELVSAHDLANQAIDLTNKETKSVHALVNQFIDLTNKEAKSVHIFINQLLLLINKQSENMHAFVNQFIPFFNELLRNQKINFYLASIAPAAITVYITYYLTHAGYNRFIKHDTWYKPMKLLVRSIDQLLNKITTSDVQSFCDIGKLHILILSLKDFMYCLSNDELYTLQEDIAELIAYDLSYAQKQRVINRMYRTYEFLR